MESTLKTCQISYIAIVSLPCTKINTHTQVNIYIVKKYHKIYINFFSLGHCQLPPRDYPVTVSLFFVFLTLFFRYYEKSIIEQELEELRKDDDVWEKTKNDIREARSRLSLRPMDLLDLASSHTTCTAWSGVNGTQSHAKITGNFDKKNRKIYSLQLIPLSFLRLL